MSKPLLASDRLSADIPGEVAEHGSGILAVARLGWKSRLLSLACPCSGVCDFSGNESAEEDVSFTLSFFVFCGFAFQIGRSLEVIL